MLESVIESLDMKNDNVSKLDVLEKRNILNSHYRSEITSENGVFGDVWFDKGDGTKTRFLVNEFGNKKKEYYDTNGKLTHSSEKISDGWLNRYYDDCGTEYLHRITGAGENNVKTIKNVISPNIEIKKSNFSSVIDEFGRPVYNKITNVKLYEGRESLSKIIRDSSYKSTDERGHLIADRFGGPASPENIVAQAKEINHGLMIEVENQVADLVKQGHKVDYSVKTNYSENKQGTRAVSFEPEIIVNGTKYELPDHLKKIYNGEGFAKAKLLVAERIHEAGAKVPTSIVEGHEIGKKTGVEAAAITLTVSTVENTRDFIEGNISAEEMVINIAKETGSSMVIGYGSGFVDSAVANSLKESSHTMLKSLSKAGVPAATIAFGVESYDSVSSYMTGEITERELAYDLGENAAATTGSVAGAAIAGAAVGSIVPGAGNAVGFGAGLVGGIVGCAITTEAYATAVESAPEIADSLVEKANSIANDTVKYASMNSPECATEVKNILRDFSYSANIPINV